MSRRSFAKPSDMGERGDRPTLERVLDHYGVQFTSRTSQMVNCPVHGDDRPSCSIDTDKQVFKCHACGVGGDAWELIKIKEGVDFDGAVAFAASHGLTTGDAGGSGVQLRGRYDRASGAVSPGQRTSRGDRPYAPSWRRRRPDPGA